MDDHLLRRLIIKKHPEWIDEELRQGRFLLIPDYDEDDPQPYSGDINPGWYSQAEFVELLRRHKDNPDAIQFLADMLET